ncbi:MAG: conjugal transfer protein [Nocardioidaceae bacterium]
MAHNVLSQGSSQAGGPYAAHQPPHHDVPPRGDGAWQRARRAGAGGRWWLWLGRAVLWAFIIVVVVNGLRVPFVRATQTAERAPGHPAAGSSGFPSVEASAYALQFAKVYLDYDQSDPDTRAALLAAYLPEGADEQFGWDGSGTLDVNAVTVAGVDPRDAHHAVVTLAVQMDDRWMRLAVPVFARQGAMVVSGEPALMPAPPKASLPESQPTVTDDAVGTELRRQLPGFFRAYAAGDREALGRYLAPETSLHGLGGAVKFASLDQVVVPATKGDSRKVQATVTWQISSSGGRRAKAASAGTLQQTYELKVTQQSDRWYVETISGSTVPYTQ